MPVPCCRRTQGCYSISKPDGERFMVVNISTDVGLNQKLSKACEELGNEYDDTPLLIRENRLNGIGHLNRRGNEELGHYLFGLPTSYGWLR